MSHLHRLANLRLSTLRSLSALCLVFDVEERSQIFTTVSMT